MFLHGRNVRHSTSDVHERPERTRHHAPPAGPSALLATPRQYGRTRPSCGRPSRQLTLRKAETCRGPGSVRAAFVATRPSRSLRSSRRLTAIRPPVLRARVDRTAIERVELFEHDDRRVSAMRSFPPRYARTRGIPGNPDTCSSATAGSRA